MICAEAETETGKSENLNKAERIVAQRRARRFNESKTLYFTRP